MSLRNGASLSVIPETENKRSNRNVNSQRNIQRNIGIDKGSWQPQYPGFIQNQGSFQNSDETVVYFNDFKVNQQHNSGYQLDGTSNSKFSVKDALKANAFDMDDVIADEAQYFAESSTTLVVKEDEDKVEHRQPPELYMVDPVSREGTSRTGFGLAPCGGGSKGKSRYLAQPGEKTEVEWIIKYPVPNGRCQINLARGHSDDPESYKMVHANGQGFDSSTGYFKCGDESKTIEEVEVQLPYDNSCPDCTIQLVYDAPGYGKMYQWSDISIVDSEHRQECEGKCKNGGICQDNKWYCTAGFEGKHCEIKTADKEAPKKTTLVENKSEPKETDTNYDLKGWSIFLWYFIWLLVALIIAAIIWLVVYFCFKKIIDHIKGDEGDNLNDSYNESEDNDNYSRKSENLIGKRKSQVSQQETQYRRKSQGERSMFGDPDLDDEKGSKRPKSQGGKRDKGSRGGKASRGGKSSRGGSSGKDGKGRGGNKRPKSNGPKKPGRN